jgi:asparagine synthase (glutamine-hydrolysing)
MSGIAGVVNRNGRPADHEIVARFSSSMAFRGPDAQQIWAEGPVALAHTLLRTADDVSSDLQPFSLDDRVWIVADARIDDRATLIEALDRTDVGAGTNAPDAELMLRAYLAWGDDCTSHLLGDFACAIWDGRVDRLWCVRDHLGGKPFFYAVTPSALVFSNTLAAVREHPAVASDLDDGFMADFLLFGYSVDADATAFAGIRRLPPAHTLEWTRDSLRLRRYWTMPVRDAVYYRDPHEYVERYRALLTQAVSDRLQTRRASVMMSGGLDSTCIAATARDILEADGHPYDLRAFTVVFDKAIDDQERHYATIAAHALGMSIRFEVADEYRMFDRREHRYVHSPEPRSLASAARQVDRLIDMTAFGRVFFTGQGGDGYLRPSAASVFENIRRVGPVRFARDVWAHRQTHGRFPRLGIRTHLRERFGSPARKGRPFPAWIQPELAKRLDLEARWNTVHAQAMPPSGHHRPEAYYVLTSAWWRFFESCDPGWTGFPIEARHPIFDLRLLDFVLTVPSVPWCVDKALAREAMRGRLPEEIRLRRKTPLAGDPSETLLTEPGGEWLFRQPWTERVHDYVRIDAGLPRSERDLVGLTPTSFRPFYLNFWLATLISPVTIPARH